jgi:hypothetical protein
MSLAAAAGTTAAGVPAADEGGPKVGELYELRVYSLPAAKQPALDRYLGEAFIPALKRYGIGPVGAFAEEPEKDQVKLHVLIVHPSAASAVTLPARLDADEDHRKEAGDFLALPASDPPYSRIDSSLLAPSRACPGS